MVKKVPLGKLLIEQKERIGTEDANGLPLLGVNNKIGLHRSTDNKIKDLSNYKIVQRNWFAYNPMRINVGSLGLALTDEQVGVVSPDYVVFSCGENLSPHYLYRFLKSLTGMIEIRKNTTGTVRERLYFKSLAKIEIPLPRILEQIDISNKLRSMESIIQQTIDENSEQLNTVDKLRQAILQLAVQGKLVPQDPKDEPASILLEKIRAEKERLVKEGKIKKSNPLPPINSNDIPYSVPNSWEWTTLGNISINIHYGYTASANNSIKDVRLLRITDIQNGLVDWKNVPGCKIDKSKVDQYILNSGDLLIARTGGTIGKTFLLEDTSFCAVFASYLIRVIPSCHIYPQYLKYFATSPLYWGQLYAKSSGTGQPNVNATSLKALIVSIPPYDEQKRIVAKIDQIMALCDELETKLSKSQTDCDELMEAAVSEILAA